MCLHQPLPIKAVAGVESICPPTVESPAAGDVESHVLVEVCAVADLDDDARAPPCFKLFFLAGKALAAGHTAKAFDQCHQLSVLPLIHKVAECLGRRRRHHGQRHGKYAIGADLQQPWCAIAVKGNPVRQRVLVVVLVLPLLMGEAGIARKNGIAQLGAQLLEILFRHLHSGALHRCIRQLAQVLHPVSTHHLHDLSHSTRIPCRSLPRVLGRSSTRRHCAIKILEGWRVLHNKAL